MTLEHIRAFRRAAMDRGDHYGDSLCNQALHPDVSESALQNLITAIVTYEDLRERVLRGEA